MHELRMDHPSQSFALPEVATCNKPMSLEMGLQKTLLTLEDVFEAHPGPIEISARELGRKIVPQPQLEAELHPHDLPSLEGTGNRHGVSNDVKDVNLPSDLAQQRLPKWQQKAEPGIFHDPPNRIPELLVEHLAERFPSPLCMPTLEYTRWQWPRIRPGAVKTAEELIMDLRHAPQLPVTSRIELIGWEEVVACMIAEP
jgi:hypothetical protein